MTLRLLSGRNLKFLLNYVSGVFSKNYIKYLKENNCLNFKTCFDIGSGDGTFVRDLIKLGIDAEGIEKDSNKVKQRVTDKVKTGEFSMDYMSDKKYDCITLNQVIFFLGDPIHILSKLKTMLNPSGIIFIVTSPLHSTDHSNKYPEHVLFSKEDYIGICSRVGLKLINYTEYQSNLSTAFNHGKLSAMAKVLSFKLGLVPEIKKDSVGNHAYMLLSNIL